MNLGAKRAELVQKFVPRSRSGIFRNEGTRSTPLDPKLMFFCISFYLTRSRVRIFRNEGTHPPDWTLNRYFGTFHTIWVHLEPFGCVMKLGRKRAELVQKFVPRSRVGIFCKEGTRSTPVDPKLMFWCVSYYLREFGTVWMPYETRCKTGRTSAKVRATKSRRNFSQRTHPIHPIRP